jgi:hypothetical protein
MILLSMVTESPSDTQLPAVASVPALVRRLYQLVGELEAAFPGRRFTPDGHLVGSIGEVLAAHFYNLQLFRGSSECHDARSSDGRNVQIKATQTSRVALRSEPEHLLVLRLVSDGSFEEIYNGPGALPWQLCGGRGSNGQRQIAVSRLRRLMRDVPTVARLHRGA